MKGQIPDTSKENRSENHQETGEHELMREVRLMLEKALVANKKRESLEEYRFSLDDLCQILEDQKNEYPFITKFIDDLIEILPLVVHSSEYLMTNADIHKCMPELEFPSLSVKYIASKETSTDTKVKKAIDKTIRPDYLFRRWINNEGDSHKLTTRKISEELAAAMQKDDARSSFQPGQSKAIFDDFIIRLYVSYNGELITTRDKLPEYKEFFSGSEKSPLAKIPETMRCINRNIGFLKIISQAWDCKLGAIEEELEYKKLLAQEEKPEKSKKIYNSPEKTIHGILTQGKASGHRERIKEKTTSDVGMPPQF
jgi:hypothetical protein